MDQIFLVLVKQFWISSEEAFISYLKLFQTALRLYSSPLFTSYHDNFHLYRLYHDYKPLSEIWQSMSLIFFTLSYSSIFTNGNLPIYLFYC